MLLLFFALYPNRLKRRFYDDQSRYLQGLVREFLDIANESDVKEILKAVDPENADETDILEFMGLLQAANNLMRVDAKSRRSIN